MKLIQNKILIGFFFFLFFGFCTTPEKEKNDSSDIKISSAQIESKPEIKIVPEQIPRTEILERLHHKIEHKEDLFVHVFVPLCDNVHQGIVPVSKTLGNGKNPRSNLYWGALYGIKTHFKKTKDWKFTQSQKNISPEILERVVFQKKVGKQNIYLIADAYQGDKMKECLHHYLDALSGKNKNSIEIENQNIKINGRPDFLIFNGHNGLMDVEIDFKNQKNDTPKDAAVIACASHGYFTPHFERIGAYPVLTTTNLLAPEAYVLEAIVNEWSKGSKESFIREAAAKAYHQYQKCGINGARRLFNNGW